MKKTLFTFALAAISFAVMAKPTLSNNEEKSTTKKVEISNANTRDLKNAFIVNEMQEQMAFENMMTAMFNQLKVSEKTSLSKNSLEAELTELRLVNETLLDENDNLKAQVSFANMMMAAFRQLRQENISTTRSK